MVKSVENEGNIVELAWSMDDQQLNPFTPTSDQDRISPYKINTISSR